MSYLALARKYRPQTFSEVLSQEFITSTLQNAIKMGRVSHSYLFTGPRGVGKTSTARIFAKALNCLNPQENGPCGECENCLEITNGTSLDVMEIDGASNRGVEEIRSLREAVKFIPVKSRYKIIIVDEVHMLTEPAFNALLKTLEEPPEYIIFIFATTDQHKIPVTILSRCQRYEFKKISYDEMMSNLKDILNKEQISYEEDGLNYVIRNSDGCMRDALSLLDQVIAYSDGKITTENTAYLLGLSNSDLSRNIFSAVIKEEVSKLPSLVEEVSEKGIDYKYMTECLIEHTRNMLIYAVTGVLDRKDITSEESEFYKSLMADDLEPRLYAVFQIFQKLLNDLKYSDFSRYMFEFGVIKAGRYSAILPLLSSNIDNTQENNKKAVTGSSSNVSYRDKDEVYEEEPVNTVAEHEDKKETVQEPSGSLWTRLLNYINAKNIMIYSHLKYAGAVEDNGERLVIEFPKDRSFQYKMISRAETLKTLKESIKTLSDRDTLLEVRLSGSEEDSVKK